MEQRDVRGLGSETGRASGRRARLPPARMSGSTASARDFLGLQSTEDPTRWRLPIADHLLTPAGAIMGGAAFAAAVEVMEAAVRRPLVWASAQFLRHAGPTGTLELDVTVELAGRSIAQARAVVHLGGVEVLTASGALGARVFGADAVWARPPRVPDPDDSQPEILPSVGDGRLADQYEVRLASGRGPAERDGTTPGTGRSAMWCRRIGGTRLVSSGDVAVLGDLVMLSFTDAVGRRCTGNSLDNSLRMVHREPTEWVLLDVEVDAAHDGFGHAHARLWSQSGQLLAITSETLVLREVGPDGTSHRRGRRIVGGEVETGSA